VFGAVFTGVSVGWLARQTANVEGHDSSATESQRLLLAQDPGWVAAHFGKAVVDLGDEPRPAQDIEGFFEGLQVRDAQYDARGV
jgi:hypothetical protein